MPSRIKQRQLTSRQLCKFLKSIIKQNVYNSFMRKLFYGIGSIAAVSAPFVATVSCGTSVVKDQNLFNMWDQREEEAVVFFNKEIIVSDGNNFVSQSGMESFYFRNTIEIIYDQKLNSNVISLEKYVEGLAKYGLQVKITPASTYYDDGNEFKFQRNEITTAQFKEALKNIYSHEVTAYWKAVPLIPFPGFGNSHIEFKNNVLKYDFNQLSDWGETVGWESDTWIKIKDKLIHPHDFYEYMSQRHPINSIRGWNNVEVELDKGIAELTAFAA